MKMRKIVAVLMAVLMLCCIIPFSAATAEEATATIDFSDKANRVSYSTSQQVWAQNGITVTNDKGASTSNVADYAKPVRFYKSSTVTIEYPGMTKIVIDSVTYDDNDYAAPWAAIDDANVTATVVDGDVTIEFASAVDSFTWEKMSAQGRAYSIAVYAAAEEPEVPAEPVVSEADFDTIVTSNANGDSSYKNTYTTESGWVTEYSAIQTGGASVLNPQFPVIGEDNTSKAVCMNGKVGASGKITSPTLTGGISKLTVNYTKMFTDTVLSATVTITDLATGTAYTHTIAKEADKNDKYSVWTDEWVLETPIAGDFTIVIANDCPSQATGNKDRMTILDVIWESNGGTVTPDEPDEPVGPEAPEVPENAIENSNFDNGEKQGWASSSTIAVVDGALEFQCTQDWANIYKYMNAMKPNTDYVYRFNARANMAQTMNIKVNNNWAGDTGKAVVDVTTEWQTYEVVVNSGALTSTALVLFSCNVQASAGLILYLDNISIAEVVAEPDVPSDPEADTELSIADAIALGASKEHNVYTEGKYYVSGVITEVYNTQYGNMKITDEAGNILTIYGTYSADGNTRYDALEVKPVAGDTVKIYGIIGQYNGTPQIKNGWIVEHTAGVTPDEPDVPVEPDEPASDLILIDAPKAGVAYKFGMIQGNVSATDVYYLIGGMAQTYYLATGTDAAAAIDVYLEETEGGYYLYTLDGTTKTYINMVVSGTHVNGAYEATASTVYTYNAEAKTIVAVVNDKDYWFGTRNDKTYTTVGPCAVEYAGFYCQFYGAAVTPDEPDVPVEPDVPADDKLTIEEAIALGQTMEHNTFTEQKYYVTGVITEVYNTQYGNMKLTDEAGNILTIYGTFSADGSLRYDAMEVKPVAGDTVTIYGIVGQYNGTSQIKNGWIVEHIAGETPDEPIEPDVPVEPDEPEADVEIATELKEGVAYKFAMNQTEKGALYFFTGVMSGYYGATETDINLAVDMYVEIVDGGYKLYFNDANGDKQYIALVQSGTHYNFTFGADASVFSWDAERTALYATAGDTVCYMGTYGSYVTVGTLKQDKLSDSDYIARLYVEKAETPDEPVDPDTPVDPDEPSDPDTPDEPGTDSPDTGDNSVVYVTVAVVLMALAAAAMALTKKRA